MGGKRKSAIYGLDAKLVSTTELMLLQLQLSHVILNGLLILIEHLLQHIDEMSRAQRPPLAPTRLDFDHVHDDGDTNDDDDDNAILK